MIKYIKSNNGYVLIRAITRQTKIIPAKKIQNTYSSLNQQGVIILLPGYWWDGATGAIDTPRIMEASCFHDAFCGWYDEGLITTDQRKQADQLFKTINKQSNMSSIRVKWTYQFVRKFLELKDWFMRR